MHCTVRELLFVEPCYRALCLSFSSFKEIELAYFKGLPRIQDLVVWMPGTVGRPISVGNIVGFKYLSTHALSISDIYF